MARAPLKNAGDLVHGLAWDLAGALGVAPVVPREQFVPRRPQDAFASLEAFGTALTSRKPVVQARYTLP